MPQHGFGVVLDVVVGEVVFNADPLHFVGSLPLVVVAPLVLVLGGLHIDFHLVPHVQGRILPHVLRLQHYVGFHGHSVPVALCLVGAHLGGALGVLVVILGHGLEPYEPPQGVLHLVYLDVHLSLHEPDEPLGEHCVGPREDVLHPVLLQEGFVPLKLLTPVGVDLLGHPHLIEGFHHALPALRLVVGSLGSGEDPLGEHVNADEAELELQLLDLLPVLGVLLLHDGAHHPLHVGYVYVILLPGQVGYVGVVALVTELLPRPPELLNVLPLYAVVSGVGFLIQSPDVLHLRRVLQDVCYELLLLFSHVYIL